MERYLGIGDKSESGSLLHHLRYGQVQILRHKAEDCEYGEPGEYCRQDVRYCHHNGVRVKVIAELQWTKLHVVMAHGLSVRGRRLHGAHLCSRGAGGKEGGRGVSL